MLSIRSLARSAPRALGRMTAQSRSSAFLKSSTSVSAALRTQRASAFSTTVFRKAQAGESDGELVAKLESEIQFEEEVKENEQVPVSVKDFLNNSAFELQDVPGKEEVRLVRSFGDEKISVSFSIADLANFDPELYDQDRALEDEEDFEHGSKESGSRVSAEEDLEAEEDIDDSTAPIRLNIVVQKPGVSPGALNIDAVAQDGSIVVENLCYYEDATLAEPASPEAAQRRGDVYPGPPFGTLDEDLQILMERYLEERGVTQALATFVPDYVDVKEQKEYVRWLSNVKGFISA